LAVVHVVFGPLGLHAGPLMADVEDVYTGTATKLWNSPEGLPRH
jgi:hypothetical protein